MSTVKISQLPEIPRLNQDTTQTLVAGVDLETGITGKMTAKVLAQSLYSNDVLNVGNNQIIFPGVVAQFVGSDESYLQINEQNLNGNGSTDMVLTADDGTDVTYFIDMGIQGSNAPTGTLKPHDGYLIVQGDNANTVGNLIIGTSSTANNLQIRFIAGGLEDDNVYAVFQTTQSHFLNNVVVDGTITGPTITAINTYSTSSYNTTNASFIRANTAGIFANGAFDRANNAGYFANGAFSKANTNAESISSINLTLLNTQNYANGAFTKANNALANTSGAVFGGDLNVSGNVVASGIQSTTGAISTGNLIVNGTQSVTGTLNVAGIVSMNAQVVLTNTTFSSTQAALTIAASPTVVTPANDGYMIHISGKNGVASRVVTDSYGTGAYALYAGRSARGTVDSPTALQSGDVISRFSSSGYGTTKYQTLGTGRIEFVASENFTDANTGTQIKFWNCPVGSNTLTNILTLNGDSASFSGVVMPQKGFVLTPNVRSGITNTLNINFVTDSLYKITIDNTASVNLSGFSAGKIVEVWMTNSSGLTRTVTHGCLANNSTTNSTTFSLSGTSSAYLKYFSIDGDQANTFVTISYS
jgi:hypothetical protein